MINHHPSTDILSEYAQGLLDPAISLLVGSHCDMCPACSAYLEKLEAREGSQLEEEVVGSPLKDDLVLMYEAIMSSSNEELETRLDSVRLDKHSSFKMDGKRFFVPRPLQRLISKELAWNNYLGKLSHATVPLQSRFLAQLILMGPGGGVPEHTHKGVEYTLVLDGEFCDGLSLYQAGDFIVFDGNKVHSPAVKSDEPCLVLSILDDALQFTNGWARLINPLSQLYFNANVTR